MMALILPVRYGQVKPPGLPVINWSHPLAAGLIFYGYDYGGTVVELVSNRPIAARVGTKPGLGTSPYGQGILWNNSGGLSFAPDAIIENVTAGGYFTWSASYYETASEASYAAVFGRTSNNNSSSPSVNWSIAAEVGSQTTASAYLNSNGSTIQHSNYTSQAQHVYTNLTASVKGGGTTFNLYAQGIQIGAPSLYTPANNNANSNVCFSGMSSAGSLVPFTGFIYWGAFWRRTLSADEVTLLWNDPYCFLSYPSDVIASQVQAAAGMFGGGTTVLLNANVPLEDIAGMLKDSAAPTEFSLAGTVNANIWAFEESITTVRRDD